jgi:hypothetical protein
MRTESLTDPISRRSFETVLEVASENEEAVVVHAWVFREGRWVVHAWCEIDGFAVDLTHSSRAIPKADYYLMMGITPHRTRSYSRLQFFCLMAEQQHLGPFDSVFFFAPESKKDPIEVILSGSHPSPENG